MSHKTRWHTLKHTGTSAKGKVIWPFACFSISLMKSAGCCVTYYHICDVNLCTVESINVTKTVKNVMTVQLMA